MREKEEKQKQNNFWFKKKKKKTRVGEGELRPGSSKTLLHDSKENWNNIMMLNWLHVCLIWGFLGGASGNEPTYQSRKT